VSDHCLGEIEKREVEMRAGCIGFIWDVAAYVASSIAVSTFMCHFWWPDTFTGHVLWGVSGGFAIFSIYGGIIRRADIQQEGIKKGMATAAAVIGCLVLLGLAVSAAWLIIPLSLYS